MSSSLRSCFGTSTGATQTWCQSWPRWVAAGTQLKRNPVFVVFVCVCAWGVIGGDVGFLISRAEKTALLWV